SKIPSNVKEGFETSREGLNQIHRYISEIMPGLPMKLVIRSFGAIRPNPFYVKYDQQSGSYQPDQKKINDFSVSQSEENPAFLSLIGIKTPGLTCSEALGRHVADRMASLLGAERNPEFDPKRPAPLRLNDIPFEERAGIVGKNPAYGRIVCRCRGISEGEIIDSIHMAPGAVTVDGVKRRTGACSGRCQGSFCTQRIVQILARELKVPTGRINKDGPGSYLIGG
ncbi:MAG TPA: (2Fe-2S)-binding protein, partial [Clostridia bacterium]|nr:(2Fe-2S)-binding protein [Clostridia bacterium]